VTDIEIIIATCSPAVAWGNIAQGQRPGIIKS